MMSATPLLPRKDSEGSARYGHHGELGSCRPSNDWNDRSRRRPHPAASQHLSPKQHSALSETRHHSPGIPQEFPRSVCGQGWWRPPLTGPMPGHRHVVHPHGSAFSPSCCCLAEPLRCLSQAAASLSRKAGTPQKHTSRGDPSAIFAQALSLVRGGRNHELLSLGSGDRETGRTVGEEAEAFLLCLENR